MVANVTSSTKYEDMEIQEKDKVHKELNGILEKQPGPEVLEQLEQYQDVLKKHRRSFFFEPLNGANSSPTHFPRYLSSVAKGWHFETNPKDSSGSNGQLRGRQETYAAKLKQMKAMQSELHTYQSQVRWDAKV